MLRWTEHSLPLTWNDCARISRLTRRYRLAQNAVTRVTVDDVAINREIVSSIDHSLSTTLDDWKVTNQERSGRCWLFAGLNLLRVGVMRKTGLKDFEFSQNYAMFWDKLERANYFLEAIIETADRDLDDRTVAFLLESAASDGGQWNMFAALVAKHGLVPKGYMPETQSSSNTGRMNSILRYQLRQGARTVRAATAEGLEAARAAKAEIMQVIYRILCIHLGTPPERFDWQWTDKDKEVPPGRRPHPAGVRRQVRGPAGQRVRLPGQRPPAVQPDRPDLHRRVPRQRHRRPAGHLPQRRHAGHQGRRRGHHPGRRAGLVRLRRRQDDEQRVRVLGRRSSTTCRRSTTPRSTSTRPPASRTTRRAMTHAMLFTGVDVLDGATRRWRVENSWGADSGKDGFYTMNDSWFGQYVFEIAARKSALPADLQSALDAEPIVLPAWDPMGALAR